MRASTTDADDRPLVELAVVAPTPSTSSPSPATGPAASAPGFSRAVRCNARSSGSGSASGTADGDGLSSYPGNAISTTKYTAASFLPKSLFEQFRRVANCFFLVVAFVSFSPLAPYRAVSVLLPLVVVVSAAMAKEAVEDWRRKQQVRAVALSVETLLFFSPRKAPAFASSQLRHWRLLIPLRCYLRANAMGEEI
jgi:phospholipid-translocating ATPase